MSGWARTQTSTVALTHPLQYPHDSCPINGADERNGDIELRKGGYPFSDTRDRL